MPRIFLSPENRPAPHGPYMGYTGVYEHDVCCEIADLMKPHLERNGFEVFIADPSWTMAQRCKWANENGINYYQCIHTNAANVANTATGTECLYYNHPYSIKANQLVYDELVKLYPSKRGIKDYSGFDENYMTTMVSCYVEIAFHDNAADAKFIVENKAAIAEAIVKGECAYFNLDYLEDDDPDGGSPGAACDCADTRAELERLQEDYEWLEQDHKVMEQRANDAEAQRDANRAKLDQISDIASK